MLFTECQRCSAAAGSCQERACWQLGEVLGLQYGARFSASKHLIRPQGSACIAQALTGPLRQGAAGSQMRCQSPALYELVLKTATHCHAFFLALWMAALLQGIQHASASMSTGCLQGPATHYLCLRWPCPTRSRAMSTTSWSSRASCSGTAGHCECTPAAASSTKLLPSAERPANMAALGCGLTHLCRAAQTRQNALLRTGICRVRKKM